ncbi:hypothetical protein BDA99DRAFT_555746 [Phascolomyces articulosus]|uniref:Uncharacterized protein n=1 Tax=Phascolomyces articulosus TaxID=60185 RepID=A0AAD5PJN5_9FUNG|nr:hypothetical protein BDA99DRAFT_555746 [Phascolomyces articulosus]
MKRSTLVLCCKASTGITIGRTSNTIINSTTRLFKKKDQATEDKSTIINCVGLPSHSTLKPLYLSYDDILLARNHWTYLLLLVAQDYEESIYPQETRIVVGNDYSNLDLPPMSTILNRLFSVCPALESIELDDTEEFGDAKRMKNEEPNVEQQPKATYLASLKNLTITCWWIQPTQKSDDDYHKKRHLVQEIKSTLMEHGVISGDIN